MNEQGCRIYFLKNNGNVVINTGEARGYITLTTVDEDFENYAKLKEYNRDQVGVIELQYGELDKLLAENKANEYKVDVTGEPKLVFSYIDYNTGEPAAAPPPTIEEVIELKVNKAKKDVLLDVVKLLATKDMKMESKDIPPLSDVLGDGKDGKMDASMVPPMPKFN